MDCPSRKISDNSQTKEEKKITNNKIKVVSHIKMIEISSALASISSRSLFVSPVLRTHPTVNFHLLLHTSTDHNPQ